jgi:hypothetical protein
VHRSQQYEVLTPTASTLKPWDEDAAESSEMRKVRKPAAYDPEELLRGVPVKVMYTAREGTNSRETLGGAGSASMRCTTLLSRAPTVMSSNAGLRMRAWMQEIQENAILLQGLKPHLNREAAMRTLVLQAMAELELKKAGRCSKPHLICRPSMMFGQDESLLMMNPVLEKVCSGRERRCGEYERPGARGGGQLLDKKMPTSSLGTHAIV